MAQIEVERKRGPGWIPWLLGLVVLLVVGYCFLKPKMSDQVAKTDSTAAPLSPAASATVAPPAGGANAAIDQFVQFAQQPRDTVNETEAQHQYTAEGTRRLAAALDAIAGGTQNITVYADSMRNSITRLQASSPNDVHADDAKAAFSAAVSAMEQLGKARGKTRDVAPIRAVYNELSSTTPLMKQLSVVERFFKATGDALNDFRT